MGFILSCSYLLITKERERVRERKEREKGKRRSEEETQKGWKSEGGIKSRD